MMKPLNVLLVSRKQEVLDSLEQLLRSAELALTRQLNTNGHVDPLQQIDTLPDLVVLHLSPLWREELEAFAARHPERRPALIVVGASADVGMMRLAMQAGARDLLPAPVSKADLLDAVDRARRERQRPAAHGSGVISTFINAQGGCGATMLACNVAHVLAAQSKKRTLLLDLDLQFGGAPLYLDLFPKRGVLQAMENLAGLDEVALEGYLARHACGLNVLSHGSDAPIETRELLPAGVSHLMDVALRSHEHLVIDLPRHIDAVTTMVLQRSQQVVLVLQQSVTALRDATRLMQWLRTEAALDRDQLFVVINRHDKAAAISAAEVQKALGCGEPAVVPNDFGLVSECINGGRPLLDSARNAAITKAVMALETRLGGVSAQARSSLLSRTFSNLLGGRTQ